MIIVPVRGINHCGVRVVSVSVINHVYLIYPGRFKLTWKLAEIRYLTSLYCRSYFKFDSRARPPSHPAAAGAA